MTIEYPIVPAFDLIQLSEAPTQKPGEITQGIIQKTLAEERHLQKSRKNQLDEFTDYIELEKEIDYSQHGKNWTPDFCVKGLISTPQLQSPINISTSKIVTNNMIFFDME